MYSKNANNTREADELFSLVPMWVAQRKPNYNQNGLVSMLIKEGIGCLVLILSDIMLKINLPGSILGAEHPLWGGHHVFPHAMLPGLNKLRSG